MPGACAVLETTATVLTDADTDLAAAMWIEAGLLRFRSGDRKTALASFEQAEQRSEAAGELLTRLARRATAPDADLEARRQVLASADAQERAVATLERFALESGRDGNAAAAADALDTVAEDGTPDEISTALTLGRALWGSSGRDIERRTRSLAKELSKRSTAAAAAAAALRCSCFRSAVTPRSAAPSCSTPQPTGPPPMARRLRHSNGSPLPPPLPAT